MIVKSFLDSNILVYSDDPNEDRRRERAVDIVEKDMSSGLGVISTQVMQEYFSVTTRKLGTSVQSARTKLQSLNRFTIVQVTPDIAFAAIDLHGRHRLAISDCLIVEAARAAGCVELLTEELQHGRTVDGLRIVDPFA